MADRWGGSLESAPISFTLRRCGEGFSPNSFTLPAKGNNATKSFHIAMLTRTRRVLPERCQTAQFAHLLSKLGRVSWWHPAAGRMLAQSDKFGPRDCSIPNPFTIHQFHTRLAWIAKKSL